MKDNYKVGIIGATGMVGQRFITLLNDTHGIQSKCLQHLREVPARLIKTP